MLSSNLEALRKHSPQLARQIEQTELTGKTTLFVGPNGDINLAYEDIALHRIADPLGEAREVFDDNVPEEARDQDGVLFMYGLGLGYMLRRAFVSTKGQIIVFEPFLDVLRQTLEVVDFTQELASPRVHIITSVDQVVKAVSGRFLMGDALKTFALPSYELKEPEIYLSVLNELKSVMIMTAVGQQTAVLASESFTETSLRNLKQVLKYPETAFLNDQFKGMPGVVVSAGPSLDRPGVIESLKAHRDNLVIAAVGTACKALDHAGITPDFVTILESKNVAMQLKDVSFIPDTNLVLLTQSHESLFNLPAKRTFVSYTVADPLRPWLSKALDRKLYPYYNQGTVSVMALVHLIAMGCNPIFLIGQDLAFPEGKLYASHAAYKGYRIVEDEKGNKMCEMENSDDLVGVFLKDQAAWERKRRSMVKGFLETEGWNGEKLLTRMCYLSFKKSLEYVRQIFCNTHLVNCSEGGAKIEGMEHLPFAEAFEKYEVKKYHPQPQLQQLLEEHYILQPEGSEDYQKVYAQYQQDRVDLECLVETTKDAMARVKKIEKALKNRPVIDVSVQKQLAKLDDMDQEMTRLSKENSLINSYIRMEMFKFAKKYNRKFILEDVELQPGDIDAMKENLESSVYLYKTIQKGARRLMETLEIVFKDFPVGEPATESGGLMVLEPTFARIKKR